MSYPGNPQQARLLLRNWPVYDVGCSATSSGRPATTTCPPSSPPSGPRSMIQSAVLMTSRLCSNLVLIGSAAVQHGLHFSACQPHQRHLGLDVGVVAVWPAGSPQVQQPGRDARQVGQ